jgi:sugar O-acyltransferase (sialic acid O-acetyltransferase NeuD family)
MKKLAIIGSGDLGQLIAYHAHTDNHYVVAGYYDDFATIGEQKGVATVLGKRADIDAAFENGIFDEIIIAIGYKHFSFRKQVFEDLKGRIPLGRVIHSNAYVAPSCTIGEGVVILPGCTLDNNVVLSDNVFLNTSATIAHDSTVKAHTFLSPRVAIAGFVIVGECCNIGINCTLIDNITLTDRVQTGGGAVVINNLDIPGLYVGVPAKLIKSSN